VVKGRGNEICNSKGIEELIIMERFVTMKPEQVTRNSCKYLKVMALYSRNIQSYPRC